MSAAHIDRLAEINPLAAWLRDHRFSHRRAVPAVALPAWVHPSGRCEVHIHEVAGEELPACPAVHVAAFDRDRRPRWEAHLDDAPTDLVLATIATAFDVRDASGHWRLGGWQLDSPRAERRWRLLCLNGLPVASVHGSTRLDDTAHHVTAILLDLGHLPGPYPDDITAMHAFVDHYAATRRG